MVELHVMTQVIPRSCLCTWVVAPTTRFKAGAQLGFRQCSFSSSKQQQAHGCRRQSLTLGMIKTCQPPPPTCISCHRLATLCLSVSLKACEKLNGKKFFLGHQENFLVRSNCVQEIFFQQISLMLIHFCDSRQSYYYTSAVVSLLILGQTWWMESRRQMCTIGESHYRSQQPGCKCHLDN